MITVLLIVHGLLAVTLLGALTHQAFSVVPVGIGKTPPSFFDRFRRVNGPAYTTPIVVLFVLTAIGGALLYPQYRTDVRPTLEDLQLQAANGVFEIKEHLVAIGLGLLPGYWYFWQQPLVPEQASSRRYLTWMLSLIVWWSFLVGHVLNNIKGMLPWKSPSLKVFSMLFAGVYSLSFYFELALFRYFPEAREFHWFPRTDLGPVILWYGWIATATLVSGAIAAVVPRRWSERLWHGWVWLAPALVTVVVLIYERRWFI